MRHTILTVDPDEEWAKVELYRWQHGALPGDDLLCPLAGLRALAKAIQAGDPTNFPTPSNVACVLRYAANEIERLTAEAKRLHETGCFDGHCPGAKSFARRKAKRGAR